MRSLLPQYSLLAKSLDFALKEKRVSTPYFSAFYQAAILHNSTQKGILSPETRQGLLSSFAQKRLLCQYLHKTDSQKIVQDCNSRAVSIKVGTRYCFNCVNATQFKKSQTDYTKMWYTFDNKSKFFPDQHNFQGTNIQTQVVARNFGNKGCAFSASSFDILHKRTTIPFMPFSDGQSIKNGISLNRRYLNWNKERDFQVIRPLLNSSRALIATICQCEKLPLYPDKSNQSLHYSRNRIRKQLLPSLQLFLNPQVENAVFQFAELVSSEQERISSLQKALVTVKPLEHNLRLFL